VILDSTFLFPFPDKKIYGLFNPKVLIFGFNIWASYY